MVDVIVVGGGIIGMMTARELSMAGATVAVYEKSATGRESSWAGGGILSPLYPWRYHDAITELSRWSQSRYQEVAEALYSETGIDPEWTRSGLLMSGLDQQEKELALAWARSHGYLLESLQPDEARQLQPGIGEVDGCCLWMPEVAQIRNPRLLKALRQSLSSHGVEIHENSPVTSISVKDGTVNGVNVDGRHIVSNKVVICGGAWSGELAGKVGVTLPVTPVRGQMLLFKAEPGLLSHVILSHGYYAIPRRDGRILVGSTLEHVGFDKGTTRSARETLIAQAVRMLPALANVEIELHWAGLRPGTSDGVPFIGALPGQNGLFVNAGQYRNGVVTGLASARLLADLVQGRSPILDPAPYAVHEGLGLGDS